VAKAAAATAAAAASVAATKAVAAKTETPKPEAKPEPKEQASTTLKEEKAEPQAEKVAPTPAAAPVKVTQATDEVKGSVLKVLKEHDELSSFAEMVSDAGLEDAFAKAGADLTVFAPTNKAIKAIPSEIREKIDEDKKNLVHFVKYHCVAGAIPSGTMIKRQASVATVAGDSVGFKGNGDSIAVGNGHIVQADLKSANGVVHIVNAALIPLTYQEKKPSEERDRLPMRRGDDEKPEARKKVNAPAIVKPEEPKAPVAPKGPLDKKPEEKGLMNKLFGF
jgi:uncharacterized surface protein with fasciclin (FAS1) repeats